MTQVHKRFTDDQLRSLFRAYEDGQIDRAQIEEVLGIEKTRFFSLWKLFRKDPSHFTIVGGSIKDTKKGIDGVGEDEAVGLAARPIFVS